jgi:hypothetical protein
MASEFSVGDRVRLAVQPPYLKTADTMPMLRPSDTLGVGAEGIVLDRRPGGYWGVKFERGAFLVDSQYLEKVTPTAIADASPSDAPASKPTVEGQE